MKEVGIQLKVGATGLENIAGLSRELQKAGVETTVLDSAAAGLSSELERLNKQQGLIDAFVRQKTAVGDASKAMADAQANAQKLGKEMSAIEEPTKRQQAAFDKARAAAKSASQELQAQQLRLQELRGALSQAGVSTDGLAAAQVKARGDIANVTSGLKSLEAEYVQAGAAARSSAQAQAQAQAQVKEGHAQAAAAAKVSAQQQQAASAGVKDGLKGVGDQLRTIQTIASAAIGGQLLGGLAGQVAQTADAYKNLESRIKLVTGEGAAFDTAFAAVFDIAKRTNSELQGTGELFTRIATAGKAIGVGQQDALRLTETINQAVQLSGASAEASKASITQLIQGLQSGALRGDEFNSVMEQAPRLAKALADGLGVTTGELRKQAEQGQLTSDVVIKALQGQAAAVEGEFSRLPATVGRAVQNLSTEWTRYVGEVDKANGISAAAARAINLLADNLDTLGALLLAAGKAAAAYKAIDLAQTFLAKAAAVSTASVAVTRSTAATTAHTAATVADTAATVANTGATGLRAAAAAQLASVLSSLKLFSLIGVVTNLKEIGTAIGETAAKWMGYGKVIEEAEARQKADEEASRKNAQAKAALGAQMQATSDAALGLNKESKALVATFDDARTKGDSVADSLGKLQKELKLGDITGIANAVTALDVLEKKGKITADQVRDTLGAALKGLDLGIFRTNALAAFDASEQGARRLKAALDAVATESLARAGTSVQELKTGFSTAMNSAINDTDALAKTLKDLGVQGEEAGNLLAKSVDKELEAAKTERALEALRARVVQLGKDGLISGDQVADALTKIQKKSDDAREGINSIAEAYRQLGLKSPEELKKIETANLAAWTKIKNDATASLATKQEAFKKYAEGAITAEGSVARATLEVQGQALGLQIQFNNTGKAAVSAMGQADEGLKRTRREVQTLETSVGSLSSSFDRLTKARNDSFNATPFKSGSSASSGAQASSRTEFAGQAVPPDDSGDWLYTTNASLVQVKGQDANGRPLPGGWYLSESGAQRRSDADNSSFSSRGTAGGQGATRTVNVNLNVGGRVVSVQASSSAADALVAALEEAQRRAGGGG